jgi:protoporphyrinogen oxidase
MNATRPRVIVLGAGPAGLGAAYALARRGLASVTVLERGQAVGGNAGSFEIAGLRVDYGSHRLHPACDPGVLEDIQKLLGNDLLDRPRHGRIRLLGRWIHFPLKPLDLALRLPPSFSLGFASDMLLKPFRGGANGAGESFATILEAKLGRTIARDFYLPYARKIWGLEPDELSPIQARRRVSADSPAKLIKKVLSAVPGLKPKGAGRFFYPRGGFGQISAAYHRAATEAGALVAFGRTVTEVRLDDDGRATCVATEDTDGNETYAADHVWSTIPVTVLARAARPAAPAEVLEASRSIHYRSMILIYLVLETDRFSEYDAHYFPEAGLAVTRISEPKNYSASSEPRGVTVLCAELPCSTDDAEWSMPDEQLGELMKDCLARAGLPVTAKVRQVATRRLPQAYPIYTHGYEVGFERLDEWAGSIPNLLTFGRQGLFAHDNTHHALYMAYSAAECFRADGTFDDGRWAEYRKVFETHVVED